MTRFAFIEAMAQAIATMEGFYKSGSLAQRNNNPGNLRAWGSRPIVNGYAYFDSAAAGWQALHSQIERNINRDLTIREFFAGKPGVYAGYAPAKDGNSPGPYADYVAGQLRVSPDVVMSGFFGEAPQGGGGRLPNVVPVELRDLLTGAGVPEGWVTPAAVAVGGIGLLVIMRAIF